MSAGGGGGVVEVAGAIDVRAIEAQLRDLWTELAGESQREDEHPVMRACVLNLLVWAPGDDHSGIGGWQRAPAGRLGEHVEAPVSNAMVDVTIDHPSRIMVLLPSTDEKRDDELEAWVTAQCHRLGKHQQVCCEQIMVSVGRGRLEHLPSLLRPLLVADLPAVLWWRDAPAFGHAVFEELAELATRVVIDSALTPGGLAGLAALAHELVEEADDHDEHDERDLRRIGDLAWSRVTSWRAALAEVFDVPEHRARLSSVEALEIVHASDSADDTEALLFAAWLATRLGLVCDGAPRLGDDGRTLELALRAGRTGGGGGDGDGADAMKVTLRCGGDGDDGGGDVGRGLVRVTLRAGPATYSVSRGGANLVIHIDDPQTRQEDRVVKPERCEEGPLLSRELAISGDDVIYDDVLRFFSALHAPESDEAEGTRR